MTENTPSDAMVEAMTDEAKALVYRMRNLQVLEYPQDRIRCADLIETQAREIERLREALDWALAEIEGRTRYSPNNIYEAEEQRANALDCARAALAGDSHDQ